MRLKIKLDGLMVALFVLFLALKLTHWIDWSWWWVCAPVWIPLVFLALPLMWLGCFMIYKVKK